MNKVFVTGTAVGNELELCEPCSLNFSWLIENPATLIWTDKIAITKKSLDLYLTKNNNKMEKTIKLILEIIKSNSIDSFSKSSFYNSLNKDSVLQISYYFYTVFYDIILTPILLILNDLERPKTAFISYFFYLCKEKMLEK